MEIVNLTPHEVIILDDSNAIFDPKTKSWHIDGEITTKQVIPSSGIIARCGIIETNDDGMFINTEFTEVEGLPESKPDTFYIVSAIIKNACTDRKDLLVPARLVRTEDRKTILGCLRLSR